MQRASSATMSTAAIATATGLPLALCAGLNALMAELPAPIVRGLRELSVEERCAALGMQLEGYGDDSIAEYLVRCARQRTQPTPRGISGRGGNATNGPSSRGAQPPSEGAPLSPRLLGGRTNISPLRTRSGPGAAYVRVASEQQSLRGRCNAQLAEARTRSASRQNYSPVASRSQTPRGGGISTTPTPRPSQPHTRTSPLKDVTRLNRTPARSPGSGVPLASQPRHRTPPPPTHLGASAGLTRRRPQEPHADKPLPPSATNALRRYGSQLDRCSYLPREVRREAFDASMQPVGGPAAAFRLASFGNPPRPAGYHPRGRASDVAEQRRSLALAMPNPAPRLNRGTPPTSTPVTPRHAPSGASASSSFVRSPRGRQPVGAKDADDAVSVSTTRSSSTTMSDSRRQTYVAAFQTKLRDSGMSAQQWAALSDGAREERFDGWRFTELQRRAVRT